MWKWNIARTKAKKREDSNYIMIATTKLEKLLGPYQNIWNKELRRSYMYILVT